MTREVNVSDSEIRKLKIVSLRMLHMVTVKQDNKKTRLLVCVFEFFLNFFSPLLFFKNSNTQVSLLSALRCKKTLSFCVYRSSTCANKYR